MTIEATQTDLNKSASTFGLSNVTAAFNTGFDRISAALSASLKKILELSSLYLQTIKNVGPHAFLAGLGLVGGALGLVIAAPHMATLASTLVGLLQSSGVLAVAQAGLSLLSNFLNQAVNLAALLGSSLLGLLPATSDLGVTAAQMVGATIMSLFAGLSFLFAVPPVVETAKCAASCVKNSVGNLYTTLANKINSELHKNTGAGESNSAKSTTATDTDNALVDSVSTQAPAR